MKDKIEVEMLSPLMAEFIPDYSDIVDLDDAEPLEDLIWCSIRHPSQKRLTRSTGSVCLTTSHATDRLF